MKLKKSYKAYNINALGALVQRVKEIVEVLDNPVVDAFVVSVDKYIESLNRGYISATGIAKFDNKRDAYYRGLAHLVNTYTESPDKQQAQVAQEVSAIVNKYGGFNVPKMSYKEETSALKRIVAKIEELPPEKIECIHLNDWLPLLKKQNDDFEKQVTEYIESQVDYNKTSSATKVRKDVECKLKAVIEYIEAILVVSSTDKVRRIYKELQEVFSR
ncbi:MAG: DUF6261 family protein [Bacteroidales bacterium]|nr:DUF6261 family protein [Bacteroidales bacterium]